MTSEFHRFLADRILQLCSVVPAGSLTLHIGVCRYGIRGLLVDPYNELDHQRPSHMSETEYVSQMLTKVKRFAQHHDVHVWFVAHPRQLRDWKGQPPTMYDISGSAHFINKADNGLVIHRNRDPEAGPMNEVRGFPAKQHQKSCFLQGHQMGCLTCVGPVPIYKLAELCMALWVVTEMSPFDCRIIDV